jgi:hypothetical protein
MREQRELMDRQLQTKIDLDLARIGNLEAHADKLRSDVDLAEKAAEDGSYDGLKAAATVYKAAGSSYMMLENAHAQVSGTLNQWMMSPWAYSETGQREITSLQARKMGIEQELTAHRSRLMNLGAQLMTQQQKMDFTQTFSNTFNQAVEFTLASEKNLLNSADPLGMFYGSLTGGGNQSLKDKFWVQVIARLRAQYGERLSMQQVVDRLEEEAYENAKEMGAALPAAGPEGMIPSEGQEAKYWIQGGQEAAAMQQPGAAPGTGLPTYPPASPITRSIKGVMDMLGFGLSEQGPGFGLSQRYDEQPPPTEGSNAGRTESE